MKKKRSAVKAKHKNIQAEKPGKSERQELTHEAAPGYGKALCIVSLIGLLYLGIIFIIY